MRNELKKLGLTDKEVEIYLAGLKTGPLSVQKLAQISKIKRPTVYDILDRLKESGLAKQSLKGKKKVFEMAYPAKLLEIAEREKKDAIKKAEDISKIVSNLEAMAKKNPTATDVKIYEGLEGIAEVMVMFAKTDSPFYSLYSTHYVGELDKKWLVETVGKINHERSRLKSKLYVITDHSPLSVEVRLIDNLGIREFRFLGRDIKLPAMVDICEDKVALSSIYEQYGCILIQNEMVAESLKFMFGVMWRSMGKEDLPGTEGIEEARKIRLE